MYANIHWGHIVLEWQDQGQYFISFFLSFQIFHSKLMYFFTMKSKHGLKHMCIQSVEYCLLLRTHLKVSLLHV